jgi:hypothetical protein
MPKDMEDTENVVSKAQQPDEGRLNGSQALVGRGTRLGPMQVHEITSSGVQLTFGLVRGPIGSPGRLL